MKTTGLFIVMSVVCGLHVWSTNEIMAADQRPNILVIITDQQHAGMMSCTGNRWLSTPALDRLAKGGIRFDRAYCANPVCSPSRTSMATGVMPCRLGAVDNRSGVKITLPPEVDRNSLGKLMKRAGYDTFYGGKVHMCSALAPKRAGYDVYFQDERDKLPGACLEFIKAKHDNPFFAVASFINPHDICFAYMARNNVNRNHVLELYRQASSLPVEQLPPLPDNYAIPQAEPAAIAEHLNPRAVTPAMTMRQQYNEKDWRIYRWIYCRLTEKVDHQIGMILDGLKAAGLDENTLIVLTSDHGNMDASHRLASKSLMYEQSVNVPLIMKYKGVIPAGRIDKQHLVSTGLDLLPTLCDYARIDVPKHLLGHSLRAMAEGRPVDRWRRYVVAENSWSRMIRGRRFKYCVYDSVDHKESLVDLENDPGELNNLALLPQYKKTLDQYRGELMDWIKISGDTSAKAFAVTPHSK